ncbi:MAG: glycosyltransferase family 39 protein [bacterium]|nr:glycosyltransferase family 39 protein [bacterium]
MHNNPQKQISLFQQIIPKPPFILTVLLLSLFLRGVTLEYGNLIDPTETRYATIAENMLTSGDWITPRLPTDNGLEPYLSKPPLHYWLTALSYSFFGIDEWTSRLPSFLGLLLIIGSVIIFASKFLSKKCGYIAGVICITSPLMFFLGGSSTVDVTFSGFTSSAIVAFAFAIKFYEDKRSSILVSMLFFIFSALAFLTKGPSAIIIIGLPIVALCIFDRSIKCLRGLSWISGIVIFSAICGPWFYRLESSTPGSVWYFFAHENFLRFTTKEYGGKYGAAHIEPYGSIWWMVFLSMLPWSFYIFRSLRNHLKIIKIYDDKMPYRWIFFVLAWGLTPILFFTFARSILPAYVIPAIPGLALYIGYFFENLPKNICINESKKSKIDWFPVFSRPDCVAKIGIAMLAFMMISFIIAAPIIEVNKSSSELLAVIVSRLKSSNPIIATVSNNDYSPYWTSGAHEQELSKPIQIVYANPSEIKSAKYKNVIIREKEGNPFLEKNGNNYEKCESLGNWHWYRRIDGSRIPRCN